MNSCTTKAQSTHRSPVRAALVSALALTAILLSPLAGHPAGASTHAATRVSAPAAVTVWDIQTGTEQNHLLAMAAAFNKAHPSTPVQYVWYQADPYKTKLAISVGAHHAPDIFMGWGGGVLQSYVKSGAVVDLTSAIKGDLSWYDRYQPSVLAAATFNGHVYGVPYNESQPEVVIYNKAIFAQYHLSVPTTWPQLLQVTKTLQSHNVIPFAMAGKVIWPEMIIVQYLADRIAGPTALSAIAQQKPGASFNTPAWIEAAQMAQDLAKQNAFENGFAGFDYHAGADAAQLLYAGRTAMMFMGVWEFRLAQDDAPQFAAKNMGFFPVPAVPGGKGSIHDLVGNPANFYSVSADSPHKAAAIAYLKEALNPTFSQQLLTGGSVPPVQGLDLSRVHDALLTQQVNLLKASSSFQQPVDQLMPPQLAQDFLDLTSSLFALSITPRQFASQMQAKTTAYYASHH